MRFIREGLESSLAPGAYHGPEETNEYYYGTSAALLGIASPLFPIAIVDLPVELVIDTILFPFQMAERNGSLPGQKSRFMKDGSVFELELLIRYDHHWPLFQKRITDPRYNYFYTSSQMGNIFNCLDGHFDHAFRYIDFLYKKDARYAADLLCDDRCLQAQFYPLYQKMFKKWLKPAEVPSEHAIFSAVIANRDAEPQLLELVTLLLENGCNPNAPTVISPPNNWAHIHRTQSNCIEKTALEEAEYLAEYYHRPENLSSQKYQVYDRLVALLRSHGAKTFQELNRRPQYRNPYLEQKPLGLSDYMHFRDLQRFKDHLKTATQEELNETMDKALSKWPNPSPQWHPDVFLLWDKSFANHMEYIQLLSAHGARFPTNLLYSYNFMTLPPRAVADKNTQLKYIVFHQEQADLMPFAPLYQYAFAHGLSPADEPRECAVLCFCTHVAKEAKTYNPNIPVFLQMLIQAGCNVNATVPSQLDIFNTPHNQTALDVIKLGIKGVYSNSYLGDQKEYQRLLTELQDMLIRAGAKSYNDLKKAATAEPRQR